MLILKEIRKQVTRESENLKAQNRRDRRACNSDISAYESCMSRFQQQSELLLEECLAQVLESVGMQRTEFDDLFDRYASDKEVNEASLALNTPEEY